MSEKNKVRFEPRRQLGRTGFVAGMLGIGDLADRGKSVDELVATIHRAMDAGLNLIDTAPAYEDGYSEQVVGKALAGRRDGMFLVDKIDHFDRPVEPQVEGSLERLGLDHVDALLFHGCSRLEDWRAIAAPGGLMEQLGAQVRKGRVRFRGISSHHPEVLLEAVNSGLCDVVMFAVGAHCDQRYIQQVLPLCRRKNVGTIGFKVFGAGKLVCDTSGYGRPMDEAPGDAASPGPAPCDMEQPGAASAPAPRFPNLSVQQCVHYTLTCDPDVALLGMSNPAEQDAAFAAAKTFSPLSEQQMAVIRNQAAAAVKGKGRVWWDPV